MAATPPISPPRTPAPWQTAAASFLGLLFLDFTFQSFLALDVHTLTAPPLLSIAHLTFIHEMSCARA